MGCAGPACWALAGESRRDVYGVRMPSNAATTTLDVSALRADTPGCAHRNHLNNAGAGLMPSPVLDTVLAHLRREAEIGGYEAAKEATERVRGVYRSVATLLGAKPSEIALLDNATRAWEAAFYSLRLGPGDRILTGHAEYGSNVLAYLQVAHRAGAEVVVVPDDEHGQIDVDRLADLVDERTKLIGVSHVPTNGGLVNPAERIGAVARAAGVPFLLDACQSVGQFPVDVDAVGCDFLTATGRKFLRGPRGTGFLYVRESAMPLLDPWVVEVASARWTGGRDYALVEGAQRFETWEKNLAVLLGLGVAIDYALGVGLPAIGSRTAELGARLRAALDGTDGVATHDLGERMCAIVTATVRGREAADVSAELARRGINTSVTTPEETSFDFEHRPLPPTVRLSPHYYNDEPELGAAVDALAGLVR